MPGPEVVALLQTFAVVFTRPTFAHAVVLLAARTMAQACMRDSGRPGKRPGNSQPPTRVLCQEEVSRRGMKTPSLVSPA